MAFQFFRRLRPSATIFGGTVWAETWTYKESVFEKQQSV
jgi:hypothetical protein